MYGITIFFLIIFNTSITISNVRSECCKFKQDGFGCCGRGKCNLVCCNCEGGCDLQCKKANIPRFMQPFMQLINYAGLKWNEFVPAKFSFNRPTMFEKKLMTNGQFGSPLCFYSGALSEKKYPNSTFDITVKVVSPPSKVFTIKTSYDQFIVELKETIQRRTGYRCDEQEVNLQSEEDDNRPKNLEDGKKLGDYTNTICGKCKFIVTKRVGKSHIRYTYTPNVTHYEYAMMSYHVYQPDKPFLNDWNVTMHNPSNKNGLAFASYVNTQRHQCVISFRGTVVTSSILSILNNVITDLRLFLSNDTIDTFDSARLHVFYEEKIFIPHLDSIPYDVSYTGHSLGAALAESFACVVQGHAVTFDSPGTSKILNNDPSCKANINKGYNTTKHISTYLGAYANLINVANPQFGHIIYLKEFGIRSNPDLAEFYYLYSPTACVFLAASIFATTSDKNVFKMGVWFSIVFHIIRSSIASDIQDFFDSNGKIFNIFGSDVRILLPFIFMLFLLGHSIFTLAGVIEHYISQRSNILKPGLDRLPPVIKRIFNWIVAFFRQRIDFNGVFYRFASLCMLLTISFFIIVVVPFSHYLYWLNSVHSIDQFVKSFNPDTGEAYNGLSINSNLWPTFTDYVMAKPSSQFLLFLLIIQSMKPVAFYLVPPSIPKYIRLNLILFLFAYRFNIDAIEYLVMMVFLFLFVFVPAFQIQNQHYAKNWLCATAILFTIMQILHERYEMDRLDYTMKKCHFEIVCYLILLLPFIVRRFRLFSAVSPIQKSGDAVSPTGDVHVSAGDAHL